MTDSGVPNRNAVPKIVNGSAKIGVKHVRMETTRTLLRPARNIRTIVKAHRKLRAKRQCRKDHLMANGRAHDKRRQSIGTASANRRKLARTLSVLAALFLVCWIPYSVCLVIWSVASTWWSVLTLQITLIFANAHAALSPLVYCIMTKSYVSQGLPSIRCRQRDDYTFRSNSNYLNNNRRCWSKCCLCLCCCCNRNIGDPQHHPSRSGGVSCFCCFIQRTPGVHSRSTAPWGGHNSSTNEENLGAFHPRYIRPRVMGGQISRCTSHYFH